MEADTPVQGKAKNIGRYLANMYTCYKMQDKDFEVLWAEQGGKCGVCEGALGHPFRDGPLGLRANIDHDHSVGEKWQDNVKVRGILCGRCNWLVGVIESPGLTKQVFAYLRKWGNL